ncbi:MAG: acyl-CoA carboxylase subunit epsilon [Demequinaceae bacterium]|nr:acyl-CoA carboxylase subunit epsilon [Demequinaceae bacterium]
MTRPRQGSPDAGELAAGLRIVRGSVDEEELAALVAGMVAMVAARGASEEAASPTSAWMDRSRTLRGRRTGVLARGDAAWRHSLR